jgi:hypothetical protein
MTRETETRRAAARNAWTTSIALTLLAVGCTSAPLALPRPIAVSTDKPTTRAAILNGMAARSWSVEAEKPDRILARLDYRTHVAKVWIDYAGPDILFKYGGSARLDCVPAGNSCSEIHQNYNRWVRNLGLDIASAVTRERAKETTAPVAAAPTETGLETATSDAGASDAAASTSRAGGTTPMSQDQSQDQ